MDAFILCGGQGTRLRSEIGENQKTLAQVGSEPFLNLLIRRLASQGVDRIVLGTGYQAQAVEGYYRKEAPKLKVEIVFSREEEPLGTGGAVAHAQSKIESDPFFVLNGDCFCEADYRALLKFYREKGGTAAIVVAPADKDQQDYGNIMLDDEQHVVRFNEKVKGEDGRVSAGIYCFGRAAFDWMPKQKKFSLETDFFPRLAAKGELFGFETEQPFVDIGTPERYREACLKLLKGLQ